MLGVTKALFCDCSRPVAGLRWRVCLQRGAHAHQEQPFDEAEGCCANGRAGRAHGATLTLFALQLEFRLLQDSFRGCYIAGQVFFTRSRSPPTPPGPGGSGNTNGARY